MKYECQDLPRHGGYARDWPGHRPGLRRARAVAGDMSRDTGNPGVRIVQADFAQLAQVRRLAHELQSQLPRLDVLINNAAVMAAARARSADGYDLTFAVNHLAPFLLTNLLLDKLNKHAPSRLIVFASNPPLLATLSCTYHLISRFPALRT